MNQEHPFASLTPEFIIDAIEALGFACDARILALNSYENRVYQVGIEDSTPLIAKFYRPDRWSREQILEEHQFCFDLVEQELPIVAPITNEQGESLFQCGTFPTALFPRRGGHAPEFDNLDNLLTLGRFLGRIHMVGRAQPFQHRPTLDIQTFGTDSAEFLSERFIPMEYRTTYQDLSAQLLELVQLRFDECGELRTIRVLGDCHVGNILWRDQAPNFIDLDDARMAPAIQDLWMMLSGPRERQEQQLAKILQGYRQFADFDPIQLRLIEPLRSLRILHHAAWIGRRWQDPAFPIAFPWFDSPRFWEEHIQDLRGQIAEVQEQPLAMPSAY